MLSKIKKITVRKKGDYIGKVYDLSFDKDPYFYVQHVDSQSDTYIKIHNSAPDIDSDFEQGRREEVRHYLESKYGKECVLGVGTHLLYHPKSAINDALRGLGKDTSFQSTWMREVNKLPYLDESKDLVGFFNDIKTKQNATSNVLDWIEDNPDTIKWADKLMGQCKTISTHAGGIVVTPKPIWNYIPVTRGAKEVVTAFKEADGSTKALSELGILKLDILGLKTLNIIQGCINQILEQKQIDVSDEVDLIDLTDSKVLSLIKKNNIYGAFQLDGGARKLVNMIKPDSFSDIVAINALNRPGPLETFGPVYGAWKRNHLQGNDKESAGHENYPKLDFMQEVLKETYGCLIYQEQFMIMVNKAAGFNLGEADMFRRCIAWKKDHPKYYLVQQYFNKLHDEMSKQGYSYDDVEYFVDYCKKFMGYSFNKSHSVSYAYIAWQTMWLKSHYTAYFFANLFNYEDPERFQELIGDMVANGIILLPPSITQSKWEFTVVDDKTVRMGLNTIKGFGELAYAEIVKSGANTSKDFGEFISKKTRVINKRVIESLAAAGAFDEFNIPREQITTVFGLLNEKKINTWFTRKHGALTIEKLPDVLKQFPEELIFEIAEEVKSNTNPCFDLIMKLSPYIKTKELSEEAADKQFFEVTNFSLLYTKKIEELILIREKYPDLPLKTLTERETENDLCYFLVTGISKRTTKTGKPYRVLSISDQSKNINVFCWDNKPVFEKNKGYIANIEQNDFGYTIVTNHLLTKLDL